MPLTEKQFPEAIINTIEDAMLKFIALMYEENPDLLKRRPYHGTRYTQRVIARTSMIMDAISRAVPGSVTGHQKRLARFAAICHAAVQHQELGNKPASIEIAKGICKMINAMLGFEAMHEADETIIADAIMATVTLPDTGRQVDFLPNITKDSHLISRVVALATLGSAGMNGPVFFLQDGNDQFRESYLGIGIAEALMAEEADQNKKISEADQETWRSHMIIWSRDQVKFAMGRQKLLLSELEGLEGEIMKAILELFSEFNASIDAATKQAELRETMSFPELLVSFGFVDKSK